MAVRRVAIIGAGVAGLTAGFRLRERCDVAIFEAGSRIGGQIETELCDGFVIERGAEGFVARSQVIPALVAELGMPPGELIDQLTLRSYGFDGQRLIPLLPGAAAGFLGFQVPAQDLGKGIRSLRRGMGSLIAALETGLSGRAELTTDANVAALEARGTGARVQLESGAAWDADGVVVATSAAAAARLLASPAGESARALAAATTHSSTTVELAYERMAIEHPLDGSGFVLAPGVALEGLRACTFTDSKFSERAPRDRVSLRLFFRPESQLADLDDAGWTLRATSVLGRVLDVRGEPLRAWVSRWPHALPVFDAAHRARVAELELGLSGHGVVLAGSAFHGSGLDAAVSSGERAAAALSG